MFICSLKYTSSQCVTEKILLTFQDSIIKAGHDISLLYFRDLGRWIAWALKFEVVVRYDCDIALQPGGQKKTLSLKNKKFQNDSAMLANILAIVGNMIHFLLCSSLDLTNTFTCWKKIFSECMLCARQWKR